MALAMDSKGKIKDTRNKVWVQKHLFPELFPEKKRLPYIDYSAYNSTAITWTTSSYSTWKIV